MKQEQAIDFVPDSLLLNIVLLRDVPRRIMSNFFSRVFCIQDVMVLLPTLIELLLLHWNGIVIGHKLLLVILFILEQERREVT